MELVVTKLPELSRNLLPLLAAEDERKLYKDFEREELKQGQQAQKTVSRKCNCMYAGRRQPIAPAVRQMLGIRHFDCKGPSDAQVSA